MPGREIRNNHMLDTTGHVYVSCYRCCKQTRFVIVVDLMGDEPAVTSECPSCGRAADISATAAPVAFRCPACTGRLLLSGTSFVRGERYGLGTVCITCNISVRWLGTRTKHHESAKRLHAEA